MWVHHSTKSQCSGVRDSSTFCYKKWWTNLKYCLMNVLERLRIMFIQIFRILYGFRKLLLGFTQNLILAHSLLMYIVQVLRYLCIYIIYIEKHGLLVLEMKVWSRSCLVCGCDWTVDVVIQGGWMVESGLLTRWVSCFLGWTVSMFRQ